MIKLSVMYPYSPEAHFDYDYYRDSHMPLLKERLGDVCLYYTIDKGFNGVAPGSNPAFIAMCHVYCESVEALMTGIGPYADELAADVANFTNVMPLQQISEVVVEKSA